MNYLESIKTVLGIKKSTRQAVNQPSPRKILIIEDDKSLAGALKQAFLYANFEVYQAENGQEGLEAAKVNKPEVILLDLLMPVMDGKTMLRKLRDMPEFKTTPVVVLTNAGQAENIRETTRYHNAIEFLIKSNVSLDEIVEKVRRIIPV